MLCIHSPLQKPHEEFLCAILTCLNFPPSRGLSRNRESDNTFAASERAPGETAFEGCERAEQRRGREGARGKAFGYNTVVCIYSDTHRGWKKSVTIFVPCCKFSASNPWSSGCKDPCVLDVLQLRLMQLGDQIDI